MQTVEIIQVTTSTPSLEEARTISRALLEKRLAASTQIEAGLGSSYWWKGEIRDQSEWRLTIKTRRALYNLVEEEIMQLHSYEVPAIQALALIGGSEAYLKWIGAEASGPESVSLQQ